MPVTAARPQQHPSSSATTAGVRKLAEIGGDGQNENFERAFSDLAHAYIREKAPSLEPYELGFEMLERSDEGDRAAGITGFQVGDQLLYSPVFWLRGRIKGHELLFLKSQGIFVPMKENWLNYMMQRKPQQIGDRVNRNPRALGIRQPDMLRNSRNYKYAAFADLDLPDFGNMSKVAEEMQVRRKSSFPGLPAFIIAAGREGVREFQKIAIAAPGIVQKAYDFHGEALMDALQTAAQMPPKMRASSDAIQKFAKDLANPKKQVGVRVIRYSVTLANPLPKDLSDLEKEKAVRDGFVIRDTRAPKDVSKAYRETAAVQLFNPTETGLYDVVTKHKGVQRCVVLKAPLDPCGRKAARSMVINLEHDHQTEAADPSEIWCVKRYDAPEWQSFLNGLPTVDDIDPFDGDEVALIGFGDVATGPLRIRRITRSSDDQIAYSVYGGELVVDYGPSQRFRSLDGKVFVPPTAKMLKCGLDSYEDPFRLGRVSDLDVALFSQMSKIAVFHDGQDVTLRSDRDPLCSLSPGAALLRLVERHGLSEHAARDLLKQASTSKKARAFIKYAEPYLNEVQQFGATQELPEGYGTHMMRSGDSVPEQSIEQMHAPVDMPIQDPRMAEEVNYVDSGAFATAQMAGQTGQKDVFDASVMTTMLRNMRDDQLIDRFIPALARAMDAVGRLLYQFYWHQEDFAERYGDRDMPEMEDSLRNLFEGLGDAVLKLKQKTVDPYPEEQQLGVSLTDLAGAS